MCGGGEAHRLPCTSAAGEPRRGIRRARRTTLPGPACASRPGEQLARLARPPDAEPSVECGDCSGGRAGGQGRRSANVRGAGEPGGRAGGSALMRGVSHMLSSAGRAGRPLRQWTHLPWRLLLCQSCGRVTRGSRPPKRGHPLRCLPPGSPSSLNLVLRWHCAARHALSACQPSAQGAGPTTKANSWRQLAPGPNQAPHGRLAG
jgi:hypothetical protein